MKATYPALPHLKIWEENEPNWQDACIEIDAESRKWSNVEETMKHIVVKDVHFASVDTVLLVNVSIINFNNEPGYKSSIPCQLYGIFVCCG